MNQLLHNILRLSYGHITAHIISIIAMPIITRIYLPEQYGVFSIYLSIVMLISPVAPLKFNYALMLPEKRNHAVNLLALSFISIFAVCISTCVIAIVIKHFLWLPSDWINKEFDRYLLFIPLGCFTIASCQTLRFWCLRNKQYIIMSVSRISESITDRAFVILSGYFTSFGATGLVFGRILGPLLSSALIYKRILLPEIKHLISCINLQSIISLSRKYREYHLLSTLSLFYSKGAREIPIILIGSLFNLTIAAYYAFTMRIVNLPILLLGDAIANVILQQSTEIKNNNGNLLDISEKLFYSLLYISLPIVIIVYFYGSDLISLIFGNEWIEAGNFTKILIISFLGQFIYKPMSVFYDTLELQRSKFVFDQMALFLRVGSILIGSYIYNSIIVSLWLLTISSLIVYFCSITYIFIVIGKNIYQFMKDTIQIIFCAIPLGIAIFTTRKLLGDINSIGITIVLLLIALQYWVYWKYRFLRN